MKYVEFTELGNPADVLVLKDAPETSLSSGQVRVKVLAAPIHPASLLQIAGQYGTIPDLPEIPGSEGIGRVSEVAEGVGQLKVGQRVMLAGGSTWQEEIVGPADQFVPLPDVGDTEQLSMLTVNPLTALLILSSFVELNEGDWIVQSAANSAVGEYIIQLAKQRGIRTVNIVRREGLADKLKALGADVVLVDGPDLEERIGDAIDGAQVAMAIDCVGGDVFVSMVESLSFGATIVSYGALSKQPPSLPLISVIFNDVRVRGFWLSKWFETASPEDKQAAFGQVINLVARGDIAAEIDSRFPLEEIKAAVTRAAESGRDGKVLIVPNPA